MGFLTPGTPPDRNYANETTSNLISQINLAPATFDAEARFSPQYADLAASNLNRFLVGDSDTPGAQRTMDTVTNAQRRSDIRAVERFGGRATRAFQNANPQQAKLLDMLNRAAESELKADTALDPALRHEVQQASRAAWSDRGLMTSPASGVEEIFLTGERANRMRRERQAFAQSVVGLNSAATVDPFMAILGRSSQAAPLAGMATQRPGIFNPESPYASDIWNTNYNANAASRIAGANNRSALIGGAMSY